MPLAERIRAAARLLGATAVVLSVAGPAAAHRVDEYLQTAQISVEAGRIVVDVYLTPGADVAPEVIASIDRSRDGLLSGDEKFHYAATVVGRSSVLLDNVALPLTLQSFEYPESSELFSGTAAIHVTAVAATGAVAHGPHVVSFVNGFRPPDSIYMANAMLPETSAIQILDQERNTRQDQIAIRFRVVPSFAGIGRNAWTGLVLVGLTAGVLLTWRRGRKLLPSSRTSWTRESQHRVVAHQGEVQ